MRSLDPAAWAGFSRPRSSCGTDPSALGSVMTVVILFNSRSVYDNEALAALDGAVCIWRQESEEG